MSLAREAMSARLAKLPPPEMLPGGDFEDEDEDEDGEAADSLGSLPPGGGMGPPAMQVVLCAFDLWLRITLLLLKACNQSKTKVQERTES